MADSTLNSMNCTPPDHLPDSLDGLVLTVANGDLGNADTSYFYFDLVKAGFNIFSLQFTIQNTTITFEASNSRSDVSNASATWTDLTQTLTGAATVTATGSLTITAPLPWSRWRVKRVTTNATNAVALNLTRGRVN